MRRRGDDTTKQALALARAASQIRAARKQLVAAHDLAEDTRARAAIEAMMSDIERVARKADAMRLRLNAKAASSIRDGVPRFDVTVAQPSYNP